MNRGGQSLFITPNPEARRPFFGTETPITALYGIGRSRGTGGTSSEDIDAPIALEGKTSSYVQAMREIDMDNTMLYNKAVKDISSKYNNDITKWQASNDYQNFYNGLQVNRYKQDGLEAKKENLKVELSDWQAKGKQLEEFGSGSDPYLRTEDGVLLPVQEPKVKLGDDNKPMVEYDLVTNEENHNKQKEKGLYLADDGLTIVNPEMDRSAVYNYTNAFNKGIKGWMDSAATIGQWSNLDYQKYFDDNGNQVSAMSKEVAMGFAASKKITTNYKALRAVEDTIWMNLNKLEKEDVIRSFWKDFKSGNGIMGPIDLLNPDKKTGFKYINYADGNKEAADMIKVKIRNNQELNTADKKIIERMQKNYVMDRTGYSSDMFKQYDEDIREKTIFDASTGTGKLPEEVANLEMDRQNPTEIMRIAQETATQPLDLPVIELRKDGTAKHLYTEKIINHPVTPGEYSEKGKSYSASNKDNVVWDGHEYTFTPNVKTMAELGYGTTIMTQSGIPLDARSLPMYFGGFDDWTGYVNKQLFDPNAKVGDKIAIRRVKVFIKGSDISSKNEDSPFFERKTLNYRELPFGKEDDWTPIFDKKFGKMYRNINDKTISITEHEFMQGKKNGIVKDQGDKEIILKRSNIDYVEKDLFDPKGYGWQFYNTDVENGFMPYSGLPASIPGNNLTKNEMASGYVYVPANPEAFMNPGTADVLSKNYSTMKAQSVRSLAEWKQGSDIAEKNHNKFQPIK